MEADMEHVRKRVVKKAVRKKIWPIEIGPVLSS